LEARTSNKEDASAEVPSSGTAEAAVLKSMAYASQRLHQRWAGEDPDDAEQKMIGINQKSLLTLAKMKTKI